MTSESGVARVERNNSDIVVDPSASVSPPRVLVFDTTLRDGEQSPGATLTAEEKLVVADALAELGVDIMEAGFPAASPGDFEAVRAIAGRVKGVSVAGLARCNEHDIERAAMAVKGAEAPRIHTFIATSDIHLEHKLRMTREQVIERVDHMVKFAKGFTSDVEFSAEDATRSDWDYLSQVIRHGHRSRRDDGQRPGHGRLHHAGRVRRAHGAPADDGAEHRPGDHLGPLPR